jgi:hypothetical protein
MPISMGDGKPTSSSVRLADLSLVHSDHCSALRGTVWANVSGRAKMPPALGVKDEPFAGFSTSIPGIGIENAWHMTTIALFAIRFSQS